MKEGLVCAGGGEGGDRERELAKEEGMEGETEKQYKKVAGKEKGDLICRCRKKRYCNTLFLFCWETLSLIITKFLCTTQFFTFCYELSTEPIFRLSLILFCSSKLLSGSMR